MILGFDRSRFGLFLFYDKSNIAGYLMPKI